MEFSELASLKIIQLQNNKFESLKNLEMMNTRQFLVFDYDKPEVELEFKDINHSRTRMADTKFEDDDN